MNNMQNNGFQSTMPSQKVSLSKKTKKWREQCVEAIASMGDNGGTNERSSFRRKQANYDLVNSILNEDDFQIVFSDTPGIIQPVYKLQESMMNFVHSAFQDADVLIYMVEIGERTLKDEKLFERIKNTEVPVLLLLNKIDLVEQAEVAQQIEYWNKAVPNAEILPISALNKFNIQEIIDRILELLPVCEPYYAKDAITDKPIRFFVEEKIREKILKHYKML